MATPTAQLSSSSATRSRVASHPLAAEGASSSHPLEALWRRWRRRRLGGTTRRLFASSALPLLLLDTKLLAASIGGTFAGGLHAVTGPDHLAALLPLCMGRRWWIALYTGGYWGLGHGIGAALVGALAFAVRGALNLDVLSTYMEAAVGISIIIIGANGVRESAEWGADHDKAPSEVANSLEVRRLSPCAALACWPRADAACRLCNGCLGRRR